MRIKKRVVALAVTLPALLGTTTLAAAMPAQAAGRTVSGSVTCVTGRAVEGVFVHANSGGGGWATLSAPSGSSSYVSWSYSIPNSGSYYVNVGCGGTPSNWASSNYSNNYSGNSSGLVCYDTSYEVPASMQYRCS